MFSKRNPTICFLLTLALFLPAASSALAAEDASDLRGRVKLWQKAFNAGKADELAAFYSEDATRMPYQAAAISGREAIANQVREIQAAGATKIELTVGGGESSGVMAWGHGTYKLMSDEGATVQEGKWMNVSKKVGSKWLIQRDIWNTSAPDAE